jgi:hypothetical protein
VRRGTGNDTKLFQRTQIVTHSSHPTAPSEFLSSRQHSADRTVVPHASIRSSTRSRVRDSSRPRHWLGADGGRMSATGNGARFGRITARAAPRGTICRMITLVAARIGGARMRSADAATRGSAGVWAWRYGMSANDGTARERLRVLSLRASAKYRTVRRGSYVITETSIQRSQQITPRQRLLIEVNRPLLLQRGNACN